MNSYLFDDEPRCGNCVYRDGCKGAMYEDGYCDEWEGEDMLSEDEANGIVGDWQYQCYKEGDDRYDQRRKDYERYNKGFY